jgi:histidine kinase
LRFKDAKGTVTAMTGTSETSDQGADPRKASEALLAALHDLRQPVQAAQLLADVIAAAQSDGERQKAGKLLTASLDSLDVMLAELAAFTRLELGEATLAPTAVDLVALLAVITRETRSLAQVRAESDVGSDGGGVVAPIASADAALLAKLLRGVVLAAVQAAGGGFGDRPEVVVRLGSEPDHCSAAVAAPGLADRQDAMFVEVPQSARADGVPAAVPGLALVARLAPFAGAALVVRRRDDQAVEAILTVPRHAGTTTAPGRRAGSRP